MKNLSIGIALIIVSFVACNSANNKTDNNAESTETTQTSQPVSTETNGSAGTKEIVGHYLALKNSLVNDDGKGAAEHGKAMVSAMEDLDKASFTPEQKKVYEDIEDDAREHAEHIGENADKIDHQREHFEMLSQDMYDLVKAFGGGQTLYKDYCPMYNDKKGAYWISETKEIKNPYMGKEMPKCGEMKEEIKQ